MKRLRIVAVQVVVTSAIDDGDDLLAETGQPVNFLTLRAFQEFAMTGLPGQIAQVQASFDAESVNGTLPSLVEA